MFESQQNNDSVCITSILVRTDFFVLITLAFRAGILVVLVLAYLQVELRRRIHVDETIIELSGVESIL